MNRSKYTVIVIPDTDEKSRQYTIGAWKLKAAIILLVLLFLSAAGYLIYSMPIINSSIELQEENQKLTSERAKVLALLQDLNRMKQMDEMIRKTLGTDLVVQEYDSSYTEDETYSDAFFQVGNVPSFPPLLGYVTQKVKLGEVLQYDNHYGIDIAVKSGEPVHAAASGSVVFSGWTYNLGNIIIIYHGDGYFTQYGHHQRNLVDQWEFVDRGDVIAQAGNTGISTGPHLHFEIWKDGKPLDPMKFFPEYQAADVSPDKDDEN